MNYNLKKKIFREEGCHQYMPTYGIISELKKKVMDIDGGNMPHMFQVEPEPTTVRGAETPDTETASGQVIVVPDFDEAVRVASDEISGEFEYFPLFVTHRGVSITVMVPTGLFATGMDPREAVVRAANMVQNHLDTRLNTEIETYFPGMSSCELPHNIIVTFSNTLGDDEPFRIRNIELEGEEFTNLIIELSSVIQHVEDLDLPEQDFQATLNRNVELGLRYLMVDSFNRENGQHNLRTCVEEAILEYGIAGEYLREGVVFGGMNAQEIAEGLTQEILIALTSGGIPVNYGDFQERVRDKLGRGPYMALGFYNTRIIAQWTEVPEFLITSDMSTVEGIMVDEESLPISAILAILTTGVIGASAAGLYIQRRRQKNLDRKARKSLTADEVQRLRELDDYNFQLGSLHQDILEKGNSPDKTLEFIRILLSSRANILGESEKSLQTWKRALTQIETKDEFGIFGNLNMTTGTARRLAEDVLETLSADLDRTDLESVQQFNDFVEKLPDELRNAINARKVSLIQKDAPETYSNVIGYKGKTMSDILLGLQVSTGLTLTKGGLSKDVQRIITASNKNGYQGVFELFQDQSIQGRIQWIGNDDNTILLQKKLVIRFESDGSLSFSILEQ